MEQVTHTKSQLVTVTYYAIHKHEPSPGTVPQELLSMALVHIREHPRKSPGHPIHSALAYTLGGLPALGKD